MPRLVEQRRGEVLARLEALVEPLRGDERIDQRLGEAFAGLVVWAVLSLGAATLAVATRRTTSAKQVLATA